MNARDWLAAEPAAAAAVAVLGAPISRASISPSAAWSTPPAFRAALARFATWDAQHKVDLETLGIRDLGDVAGDRDEPDASQAHARIQSAATTAARSAPLVFVIGGDNSLTRPAMQGVMAALPERRWGLLTFDAHHDCRPADQGSRNGTPVRELIEAGLAGERVAQVGIATFGNAREHADWAVAHGVHVYSRARVLSSRIGTVVGEAVSSLKRAGASALYVDFDLDVVDRAFAPACPASLPGGLLPDELLAAAHAVGREPSVLAADITEVDANADLNGMTVRLAAAVFLAFCSGVATRSRRGAG
jgi:formiminoglutamase